MGSAGRWEQCAQPVPIHATVPQHPLHTFFLCLSFAYVSDRTSLFFIWLVCCPMVGAAAAAAGAALPPASSLGRFLLLMAGKLQYSAVLLASAAVAASEKKLYVMTGRD